MMSPKRTARGGEEIPIEHRRLSRREFLYYLAATGLLTSCKGASTSKPKRKRILIVGSGLAGLAAGINVLEKTGSEVDVDLISQGHLTGGKVTSWSTSKEGMNLTDEGFEGEFLVGHGFHAVFGFYTELLSLLRRAGADLDRSLVNTNRLLFFHEERDNLIHRLAGGDFVHSGITPDELSALIDWAIRNSQVFSGTEDLTYLDEYDFRKWAVEKGLPDTLVDTSFIRYAEHVFFNHPDPVSAYIVVQFLRNIAGIGGEQSMSDSYFPRGDSVESLVKPLIGYFESIGGKITPHLKATKLNYSDNRVTGIEVAQPDPPDSHHDTGYWPDGIVAITDDPSALLDEYDGYILAIPYNSLLEFNPGDSDFWSEKQFADIKNLRSGSSLSCRFWCREPVGTEQYPSIINGMPNPAVTVIDYARILERYADGRWASVIDTTGAANAYEDYEDQELLEYIAGQIGSVTGLRNPLDADPEFTWVRRNAGRHGRLMLPVPGGLKYRPWPTTPFDNLVLVGDWVRNTLDMPTMEGAIRSAIAGSNELIERI